MYTRVYQRDTLKKVLNMADIKDVKKANTTMAFRMATENIFPLMSEFQKRGINLQKTQDTVLK